MTTLSEELVYSISSKINSPLVLRGFVSNWSVCQWDTKKWSSIFGDKDLRFRCMKKNFIADEPCWERKCEVKSMKFQSFIDALDAEEWNYFDYKYLHECFNSVDELFKEISWSQFGYPNKGAVDTTLWMGSAGAHTPAHRDTYGLNIVAQLYGKKRWIVFPPETGGLRPTRVPYEESSVYSELNFYCPNNLDPFKGLTGGRVVELSAGDALILPRGWWHYVQNIAPLNIAVNMWVPHETDVSTRVSEALIKIFVAQICKDLPEKTRKLIVNPNEDDIVDTPLAVLFLELDTVVKAYLDNRRKTRRIKRQRTCEGEPETQVTEEYDLKALLENPENKLELAKFINGEDIINLLKSNLKEYTANVERALEEDEIDGCTTTGLGLTKSLIDSYSESSVIEQVKSNLFARLS